MAGRDRATPTLTQGVGGGRPRVSARDWWIIGLLLAFFTLNFADKAAIGLSASDIKRDLGLSETQYGMISSGFFWLFAVGAIVLSLAFRRIGWRWSGTLLMLAWVISMAPLMFPTTVVVLLMSRMVLGFFEGPAHGLCQSIVADKFPPETRAFAGSVVNAGASVGPLIGAPVLTWVILTWNWHAAFIALIVVGLAWVVVWQVVTRRAEGMGSRHSLAMAETELVDRNADIDVPFSSMLKLGSFWGVASLSFAGYLISSLKVAWLPSFLHEGMGYSQGTVGVLVTIPYALAVVVVTTSGLISGRMLRAGFSSRASRGLLTMGYLCFAGVTMIAFTLVPAGPVQLVLVVAAFAINSVAFVTGFAGAADFLPRKHRTSFFGCIIAAYSVAGIVAPWTLGVIVDAGDTIAVGYQHGFLVVGITICVFAVIGGLLLNPERSRAVLLAETARRHATKETVR